MLLEIEKTHNFCGLDIYRFGTFAQIPDIIIYIYDSCITNLGKLHFLEIRNVQKIELVGKTLANVFFNRQAVSLKVIHMRKFNYCSYSL